jgi:hypothetical protein
MPFSSYSLIVLFFSSCSGTFLRRAHLNLFLFICFVFLFYSHHKLKGGRILIQRLLGVGTDPRRVLAFVHQVYTMIHRFHILYIREFYMHWSYTQYVLV